MTKLISECISKKSFTRFGHKILIRNETSHTQFIKCELISTKELKENGIIIEMPVNICQKGHNLTLFFLNLDTVIKNKLSDTGPYKDAIMTIMAKVENIEDNPHEERRVYIDLNFTQNDVQLWKKFIQQYADNQEEIDSMIQGQHSSRDIK
jgi:hypothetical protein